MKILSRGSKPKTGSAKVDCTGKGNELTGCGARLLITAEDLYLTSYTTSRTYGGRSFETFCCPVCGSETDVETDLPDPSGSRPSKKERIRRRNEWRKWKKGK